MARRHQKKRKIVYRRLILSIVAAAAAICVVVYLGMHTFLSATSDSLLKHDSANAEQGSAIIVDGSGRRDGVFSLLIAATDEEEVRTDSMMVLVFDTVNHTANIINIPRDTLVVTDRKGAGRKINAAYGDSTDTMLDEVSTVIGFRPDKYLVANFQGIADIVDVIGGIDYEVPFDMSYHDPSQNLSIEFDEGYQHLDGQQVVEFLRWRHNDDGEGYEDGDAGRVTKLQNFLVTLGKEVLTPANILKIPNLANAVTENVTTDLSSSQVLWIGMQSMKVDMETGVKMETLYGDPAMLRMSSSSNGWFYIADEDMIIDQINESFNPYTYDLTEEDFDIETPDTLGVYSSNWENEKEYRYAMYAQEEAEAAGSGEASGRADSED